MKRNLDHYILYQPKFFHVLGSQFRELFKYLSNHSPITPFHHIFFSNNYSYIFLGVCVYKYNKQRRSYTIYMIYAKNNHIYT